MGLRESALQAKQERDEEERIKKESYRRQKEEERIKKESYRRQKEEEQRIYLSRISRDSFILPSLAAITAL